MRRMGGARPIAGLRLERVLPYVQVMPLAVVLLLFLVVPLVFVGLLSFWEFDDIQYYPSFTLANYRELFASPLTWKLMADTITFTAVVWLLTVLIGFTCSYFLTFHVRTLRVQILLLLICTIPFWTSNVIRMISWIPFLGKQGVFNQGLMAVGVIDQPLEFLLYSDFAVIVCYVNLFTLFMIVPIFNSMVKIDLSIIEAARDAGANSWNILTNIIIPLSRSGIVLGTIFVVTLVMGDFFVVKIMSGSQSANVVSAMKNEIDQLYYPPAAASAMLLILIVVLMITLVLRIVDVRKELVQ